MRAKIDNESEKLMSKVGTMNEIRKIAEENLSLKEKLIASLQTPINLISDVFNHRTAEQIKRKPLLQEFLNHCCTARHYFFVIKKCGKSACTICYPLCCSQKEFEQLHYLPDPVPGDDLHYKPFEKLYGIQTTEQHRPSLHTMPFCPSAARAKNIDITMKCIECEKSRLLFSAKKLSENNKTILQGFLDTIFYTCRISFHGVCDLTMAISPNNEKINNQENIDKEDENEQFEPENVKETSEIVKEEVGKKWEFWHTQRSGEGYEFNEYPDPFSNVNQA
ncbi:hypothetical protein Glove_149g107 [Diversispora epigaea]|uniref:Uncharacterized protein n=1 Tax=Diversispora epigaea TaxID=1348612 RepID=A0A397J222_9GLOM|nr:hypothetical protein Glove_149g107 [Diversispora epigaea]